MKNNFVLICERWHPLAGEYVKFLNRNGLDTIMVLENHKGVYSAKVYADEEKYLKLSFNDTRFAAEEKHIDELIEIVYRLLNVIIKQDKENEYE